MVGGGDDGHAPALKEMKGRWKHPIAGMGWYREAKRNFAALARELSRRGPGPAEPGPRSVGEQQARRGVEVVGHLVLVERAADPGREHGEPHVAERAHDAVGVGHGGAVDRARDDRRAAPTRPRASPRPCRARAR